MAKSSRTKAKKNAAAAARGSASARIEGVSGRAAIVVLVILGLFFFEVRDILLPFVLAGAIAYAATPLVEWGTRRTGWPRCAIAAAVFLAVIALAAGLAALALPPLLRAAIRIFSDLQGTIERTVVQAIGDRSVELFGRSMNAAQIAKELVDSMRRWFEQLGDFGQIGDLASFAAMGIAVMIGVILTIVILGFFLIGGPQIARGLFWLVPPRQRPLAEQLWARIDPVLKRFLLGVAIIVAYSTAVAFVGLGLVLHVRHAGILAVMTGLLEIIPFAGPISAATIAGLVALSLKPGLSTVIGFAIYATLLRVSIDEFIAPVVLGRAAHIHPVLVIFALLSGGILFGLSGILLAVPVALSAKVVLATIYGERPHVD